MPTFERADVSLYYEEYGSGVPLLLMAPGGMRSAIEFWHRSPFDPTVELAKDFRVIAMDQRNAGKSRAPISASDGWQTYAADQIALLDHLGIRQCHIMGGCIGSSYCLGLIKAAPERIVATILQNPIGLGPDGIARFHNMFEDWATELRQQRPDVDAAALAAFRANMFSGDFVFAVSSDRGLARAGAACPQCRDHHGVEDAGDGRQYGGARARLPQRSRAVSAPARLRI
jgi:pimeloyl-ACP methyl ester carboxylesterase